MICRYNKNHRCKCVDWWILISGYTVKPPSKPRYSWIRPRRKLSCPPSQFLCRDPLPAWPLTQRMNLPVLSYVSEASSVALCVQLFPPTWCPWKASLLCALWWLLFLPLALVMEDFQFGVLEIKLWICTFTMLFIKGQKVSLLLVRNTRREMTESLGF